MADKKKKAAPVEHPIYEMKPNSDMLDAGFDTREIYKPKKK